MANRTLNYPATLIEKFKTREGMFDLLRLSIPTLMGIYIFSNPFPHTTAIKQICFYLSIFPVFILIYSKKIESSFRSPLTIPFALFTTWVFIGLFFALDKRDSIHDFRAHLLNYLALYYILINFFNTRRRFVILSWIIIVSAAAFSIWQIYYFYFMLGKSFSTKLVTGIPEIPVNWVGYITVPAAIISLRTMMAARNVYVKTMSFIALCPIYIISMSTQTRSTALAFFLAVIILCFKNKKFLSVCLAVTLIIIAVGPFKERFFHVDLNSSLRLHIHYTTMEVIKSFPITGIGFGMETYGNEKLINLKEYNKKTPPKYRRPVIRAPHSMPFSIAVRTGLVGLALFFYILFIYFKMGWSCMRHGKDGFIKSWGRCLVGMLVAVITIGIFEPLFTHIPEGVFYTALAMMTIMWKLDNIEDPTGTG